MQPGETMYGRWILVLKLDLFGRQNNTYKPLVFVEIKSQGIDPNGNGEIGGKKKIDLERK